MGDLVATAHKIKLNKADRLWRTIVKSKGNCEWCGKPGRDCHHQIGRSRHFLRNDPRNGVYLCASCHWRFHNVESDTGWEMFKRQRPGDYEYICEHKHTLAKPPHYVLDKIIEDLEKMIEDMNAK